MESEKVDMGLKYQVLMKIAAPFKILAFMWVFQDIAPRDFPFYDIVPLILKYM